MPEARGEFAQQGDGNVGIRTHHFRQGHAVDAQQARTRLGHGAHRVRLLVEQGRLAAAIAGTERCQRFARTGRKQLDLAGFDDIQLAGSFAFLEQAAASGDFHEQVFARSHVVRIREAAAPRPPDYADACQLKAIAAVFTDSCVPRI